MPEENKKNIKKKTDRKISVKRLKKTKPVKENMIKREIINANTWELDEFLMERLSFGVNKPLKEEAKNKQLVKDLDQLINDWVEPKTNQTQTKGLKISLTNTGLNSEMVKKLSQNAPSAHLLNLNKSSAFVRGLMPCKKALDKVKIQQTSAIQPKMNRKKVLDVPKISLLKKRLFFFKSKSKPQQPFIEKSPEKSSDFRLIYLKIALNFCLVALLILVPIKGVLIYQHLAQTKGQVLGATEQALNQWQEGVASASAEDWQNAELKFNQAGLYFNQANQALNNYNQSFINLIKGLPLAGSKIAQANDLIKSGELISASATSLSALVVQIKNNSAELPINDIKNTVSRINENLSQALKLLNNVNQDILPEDRQEIFKQLKKNLPAIALELKQTNDLFNFTLKFLGYDGPKRYLFIFQNNDELRSTGGFMGSFALVDVKNGSIINLETPGGGFYDLKGDFFEKIIAPRPFHLLGTAWQIWNANWWPDFPTSAKKIIWFFEHSNWPTPDGVVSVNATVLPEILKLTGNISLPAYNQLLTPETVIDALEHETELDYDKEENKPKKIIGDLMPIVIDKLLKTTPDQYAPLILTLKQSINNKDIQIYLGQSENQNQAKNFGLTGEINLNAPKDYLRIDRTNVAGGKTDLAIKQEVKHYAKFEADGSIIDTVAVTLTHNGNPADVFERVQNNSFIRVYVPRDSRLLQASGYDTIDPRLMKEIYPGYQNDEDLIKISGEIFQDETTGTSINNEFNKTVFGHWLQIKPGESKTLTFSYKLPFKLELQTNTWQKIFNLFGFNTVASQDSYAINFESQSGVKNANLESYVLLPENLKIHWSESSVINALTVNNNGSIFKNDLTGNFSYALLINK